MMMMMMMMMKLNFAKTFFPVNCGFPLKKDPMGVFEIESFGIFYQLPRSFEQDSPR